MGGAVAVFKCAPRTWCSQHGEDLFLDSGRQRQKHSKVCMCDSVKIIGK